jgi:erythrin-vacuolar iron transport family protein
MRRDDGGGGRRSHAAISDPNFHLALVVAVIVVLVELGVITWIRHRYMDTPTFSAAMQVALGGALVFVTGVLIGSS